MEMTFEFDRKGGSIRPTKDGHYYRFALQAANGEGVAFEAKGFRINVAQTFIFPPMNGPFPVICLSSNFSATLLTRLRTYLEREGITPS